MQKYEEFVENGQIPKESSTSTEGQRHGGQAHPTGPEWDGRPPWGCPEHSERTLQKAENAGVISKKKSSGRKKQILRRPFHSTHNQRVAPNRPTFGMSKQSFLPLIAALSARKSTAKTNQKRGFGKTKAQRWRRKSPTATPHEGVHSSKATRRKAGIVLFEHFYNTLFW